MKKDELKKTGTGKYFSLLIRLGMSMVLSILCFFSIGLYLDRLLGTGVFVFLGVILGLIIGFYLVYREIMKMQVE